MARFSDTTRCPDCTAPLPPTPDSCPACGLPLTGPLAFELADTLAAADSLLDRLRASATPTVPTPSPAPDAGPGLVFVPDRRRGLEAASLPKILLGLGAVCLLVAAVTFLAVAWSSLSVGGRTAVLVALTLTCGGTGAWLARRGLQVAAESLTGVAFGLLVLDVVGADNAGWLGDLSLTGLAGAVGAALAVAGLSWTLVGRTTPLAVPQLAAVAGVSLAGLGLYGQASTPDGETTLTVVAVLAHLALVFLGRAAGARVLPVAALGAGALWWTVLALDGLVRAGTHPTVPELWAGLHVWPLVSATVLLAVVGLVLRRHPQAMVRCEAGAAVLASVAVAMPALDNSATSLSVTVLAAVVGWSVVLHTVPRGWAPVPVAPLLVAGVPGLAIVVSLSGEAVLAAASVGAPFTRAVDVRIGAVDTAVHPAMLVPLTLALLLAGVAEASRGASVLAVVREHAVPVLVVAWLAGVGAVALTAAPVAAVVVGLLVAAAALVVAALPRVAECGTVRAVAGVLAAFAAVLVALPSGVLTAAVLAVLAALLVVVAVRGRFPYAVPGAELLLPATVAALVWTVLEVVSVDPAWRAAPILVLGGAAAAVRARPVVEVSAWASALVAVGVSVPVAGDVSVSLALHLTVAGVLVVVSSLLHPSRRGLGWVGGLLLAAATWVRLADLGVEEPEAYTLPSAVALVGVGLWHLWRNPDATTRAALGPGLGLATVPSLLVVLAGDPVSLRAALLGGAALALLLAGVRLRWSAPVTVGAVVGGLLVVRELAPYAAQTPQWVLIGAAGAVLTVVGVTWESRLRDVRRGASYLTRLR